MHINLKLHNTLVLNFSRICNGKVTIITVVKRHNYKYFTCTFRVMVIPNNINARKRGAIMLCPSDDPESK